MEIGFLLLILAIVILLTGSIVAYYVRLKKITRGELRDRHSNIPDPHSLFAGIYRVAVLGLIIVTLIALNYKTNKIIENLEDNNRQLVSKVNYLEGLIEYQLTHVDKASSVVTNAYYDIVDTDYDERTVTFSYKVTLKEYSDTTQVKLVLNDTETELNNKGNGYFEGIVTADIFMKFSRAQILVVENGKTIEERNNGPKDVVFKLFPVPTVKNYITSKSFFGFFEKNEGWYSIDLAYTEEFVKQEVEKITVEYYERHRLIKVVDVTDTVKEKRNHVIYLDKDTEKIKDLDVMIKIYTRSGYVVHKGANLIGNGSFSDSPYICDMDGRHVWNEDD